MTSVLLAALLTTITSAVLGAAVMVISGASRWHPAAPAVGLAALLVLASTAQIVPGRSSTAAVVLVVALAACAHALRRSRVLPPIRDLVVVGMTLLPFAFNGRAGTLGVGVNNDMGTHLAFANGLGSDTVHALVAKQFAALADWYPLAPHSVVSVLATIGLPTDLAFSGFGVGVVAILGWTAAGWARPNHLALAGLVAATAGVPYLVAAYFGQGAFKETTMAVLVLGILAVSTGDRRIGNARLVPFAVVVAAMVGTYGPVGLTWVVAIAAVAGAVSLANTRSPSRLRHLASALRDELRPTVWAASVWVILLLPGLSRDVGYVRWAGKDNGTGIAADDLGNLAGSLSPSLMLGYSDHGDFRELVPLAGAGILAVALLSVLLVMGAVVAIRGRRIELVIGGFATAGVWTLSSIAGQSPYVVAKSLVIAAPIVTLLLWQPIIATDHRSFAPARTLGAVAATAIALLLLGSSLGALRASSVGPRTDALELQQLDAITRGRPTLFLGVDDFVRWEMPNTPVQGLSIGRDGYLKGVALRPQKDPRRWAPPWTPWAVDLDSVPPSVLNSATWIVTTADGAASAPPPGLRIVRRASRFTLWKRISRVPEYEVLHERQDAGARLRCPADEAPSGWPRGATAVTGPNQRRLALPSLLPGDSAVVGWTLPRGRWALSISYTSPVDIAIGVGDLETTVPAALTGRGNRWPAGNLTVGGHGPVTVRLRAGGGAFTPRTTPVQLDSMTATSADERVSLPVRDACGTLVDHILRGTGPSS